MPAFKPKADIPGKFTVRATSYDWWMAEWIHENSRFRFISPKRERALEIVEAHAEQITGFKKRP